MLSPSANLLFERQSVGNTLCKVCIQLFSEAEALTYQDKILQAKAPATSWAEAS